MRMMVGRLGDDGNGDGGLGLGIVVGDGLEVRDVRGRLEVKKMIKNGSKMCFYASRTHNTPK